MLRLPKESLLYFGDTARVPYGNKSEETVITYSRQIARFLCSHEVKAIVIACNTASAFALDTLAAEFPVPVIGVVKPGAKAAAAKTAKGRIGVIATSGTIKSGLYERYLASINPELKVFGKACPLFVPLVEEGGFSDEVTREVIRRYIRPLIENKVDTVILGCTHYPLLRPLIQEEMGENVTLINVSEAATQEMKDFLHQHGMEADRPAGTYDFYASDSIDQFRSFSRQILDIEDLTVSKVSIEK